MRAFRDLIVWQKTHQLTLDLYRVTKSFPRDEQYGLTSQIRRAAASVGANIAEGCGRGTARDFARFVQMALARRASWNMNCYSRRILVCFQARRIRSLSPRLFP